MGVYGQADVFRGAVHLDGQGHLRDQVAGVGTGDARADDAPGLFIE